MPVFNSGDRNRGAAYHRQGAVFSMKIADGFLTAEVEGSYGFYEVTLDVEDFENEEAISCTCPRFHDGFYCKHIWATILQYESAHGSRPHTNGVSRNGQKSSKQTKTKRNLIPQWQALLQRVAVEDPGWQTDRPSPIQTAFNQESEICYVIDVGAGSPDEPIALELSVLQRIRKTNGEWGKPKSLNLTHSSINEMANSIDQDVAIRLMGADRNYTDPYGYRAARSSFSDFEIDSNWSHDLCELLVKSERAYWTLDKILPLEDFIRLESFDFTTPAEIGVDIQEQTEPKHSALMRVTLQKDGLPLDNEDIVKIADNGIVLLRNGLIQIDNPNAIELWREARKRPLIEIKKAERAAFLQHLSTISGLSFVQTPESWQVKQPETATPVGVLKLHNAERRANELSGEIIFAYGKTEFSHTATNTAVYDERENCWSGRDHKAESILLQEIAAFPITDTTHDHYAQHDFRINKKHLVRIVDELGDRGWKIGLAGKPIKHAGEFDISVESGQDWFDLAAHVSFDGETIPLPSLLQAVSKKENFIILSDGSRGRIPVEVIQKYARLVKFGQVKDDKIRFRPSQAMLLDAMLDSQTVRVDKSFKQFRKKLQSFTGVKPKSPPRGFKGELRKYQSEGLGWLHFLREFQFGGCLADDMGLGKTIQVLALLDSRRTRKVTSSNSKPELTRKKTGDSKPKKQPKPKAGTESPIVAVSAALKRKPTIVIVPKSLIFNWIEEAAKFTPRLRVLDYTGTDRQTKAEEISHDGGFDVLLTTYGTLRKDIAELSQIEFDYAILDESQAIKNSNALCARSSRLLRANHRLAMTGTPIENHLGELWSLFEFLNPGMLGGSTNFAKLTNQKKNNAEEREETLVALSKAIQPFLLRRTKEQVLTDLPPKTEQTLYCDMLPSQKKAYNELKEYYRVKLTKKVETDGIGRSKIQVLEALLRLRQVACDPRLLDDSAKAGAKLDLLQQQMSEIVSEGHKVLVFSQFTSLLALVKQQFYEDGINFEYLDGKTRNRAASVKRFQEDESVSAFLISIKAGGQGLNLTAADYVFLLDPWWNPAVEAQAIDRAHRIGQQNPLIAYRMISRDTVEEKIVSLQQSKRDLADKIIRADESLIRSLTADDLRILFE